LGGFGKIIILLVAAQIYSKGNEFAMLQNKIQTKSLCKWISVKAIHVYKGHPKTMQFKTGK